MKHWQNHNMNKSGRFLEFVVRQTKRVAIVAIALFLLFVIVMVIIWAVPKIWNWAMG